MPLRDYAHWNEDAQRVWWEEEGRHGSEEPDYDPDDYLPDWEDADEEEAANHFEDPRDYREDEHLDMYMEDRMSGGGDDVPGD